VLYIHQQKVYLDVKTCAARRPTIPALDSDNGKPVDASVLTVATAAGLGLQIRMNVPAPRLSL
jgi:hypothetical protein